MRTLLLALTTCLFVLPANAEYSGGTGEPNDPYQIATAADLVALGETPADYDKHFILTADIDLDPNLPGRKVFDKAVIAPDTDPNTESGFEGTPFTGVFDGNGHIIRNVVIDQSAGDCIGLIGCVGRNGTVQHLTLVNAIINGGNRVGGLAGYNNEGVISGCQAAAQVSGHDYVGGLVGWNEQGVISMCSAQGGATGRSQVGGLVGHHYHTTILNCSARVSTTGESHIGGLVGHSDYGALSGCCTTGAASGTSQVGGLAGYHGNGEVRNCYSHAGVTGGTDAGGLMGNIFWVRVSYCYATGKVTGTSAKGGLVGYEYPLGSYVTSCFWDVGTSGCTTSGAKNGRGTTDTSVGKTTAEMKTESTFTEAAWDFVGEAANGTEDIWWINEGKAYPRLSWEGPAGMVFVDIPAGTFEMGDHDGVGYSYERPVHTVTLDGFQMNEYETTNAQYAAYLNAAMSDGLIQVVSGAVYASSDSNQAQPYCDTHSASSFSQIEYIQGQFTVLSRDGKDMSDHPVVQVSWYGAKAFCDYYGYRLPTEAEWEYAARGGYHDPYYKYPWGSNIIDCSKANYRNGSSYCNPLNLTFMPYTSPVGYYDAQGAYGLCDMSGSVWEWCQDWCDSSYYRRSPADNPTGPSEGTYRALRGGSWNYTDNYCRVSFRHWNYPDRRTHYYGFRMCR